MGVGALMILLGVVSYGRTGTTGVIESILWVGFGFLIVIAAMILRVVIGAVDE